MLFALSTAQALAQIPTNPAAATPPANASNPKFKSVQQKNVLAQEKKELETMKKGVEAADIYVACKYYFSKLFNTRENVSRKNICNGYFFGATSMLLLLQQKVNNTLLT